MQQSLPGARTNVLPVDRTNGLPVAGTIDVRRSDSIPVPSSSPVPSDEPPNAFVNAAVVDDETGIAPHAKHKSQHGKAVDGTPGSGNTHRRRGAPTVRRTEEAAKSKTAHHRGKANSTVNRTSHGEKRRAALTRPGSREDREDQANRLLPLVSAKREQYFRRC